MANATNRREGLPLPPLPQLQAPAAREVELKLSLRARDVRKLRARLDRLGRGRTERVDSIYYDTPKQDLAGQKAALRLRSIGQGRTRHWVQTFKTAGSGDALSERGEWEVALPRARIDPALLADSPLQRMLAGDGANSHEGQRLASLRPLFRTTFDRTTWEIARPGMRIEASIDLGAIQARTRSEAICEAELELRAGSQRAVLDLALKLSRADGRGRSDLRLLPYGASKAERGYRLALDRQPAPVTMRFCAADPMFSPAQGCANAARKLIGIGLGALLANVCALPESTDTEYVHQARVALRRMRSGLDLLARHAGVPVSLQRELRHWMAQFGETRDWDVLCDELLPGLAGESAASERPAWERLLTAAGRRRAVARERLLRQLDTPAFSEFALRALRWSCTAPKLAGRPLQSFAGNKIDERIRRLAAAARKFRKLPEELQHKVRKQTKSLRYGIEMLQESLPKRVRRTGLRALARLQNAMGSARDALLAQAAVAQLTRSAAIRRQVNDWAEGTQDAAAGKMRRIAAKLKAARAA